MLATHVRSSSPHVLIDRSAITSGCGENPHNTTSFTQHKTSFVHSWRYTLLFGVQPSSTESEYVELPQGEASGGMRKRTEADAAVSSDLKIKPAGRRAPSTAPCAAVTGCVALGLTCWVLEAATVRDPEVDSAASFARPAACFVQGALERLPPPPGTSQKERMYECFRIDVERGRRLENPQIPPRRGGFNAAGLRMTSFNVHFFRSGYSSVELADSFEEVIAVITELNSEVIMLQEVPQSLVEETRRRLRNLGYEHSVAAGSADVHVLPASSAGFPGQRLHVLVASKLPLLQSAAVPMHDGHAAMVEVDMSSYRAAAAPSLLVYSVHLSVRCNATKRRDEIVAVLRDAATRQRAASGARPVIIAGDMNQPNAADYPTAEWDAMAVDLLQAKLPLSDGVMDALRARGFVPTHEAALVRRPVPATSAWNGALVDYCYIDSRGLQRELRVEASYVFHTLASDHLPLVVDFLPSV